MVKVALLVRLEAKPGKEEDIADFLRAGLSLVEEEPATTGGSRFGWDRRHSASSTLFRMKRGGKLISRARLRRR